MICLASVSHPISSPRPSPLPRVIPSGIHKSPNRVHRGLDPENHRTETSGTFPNSYTGFHRIRERRSRWLGFGILCGDSEFNLHLQVGPLRLSLHRFKLIGSSSDRPLRVLHLGKATRITSSHHFVPGFLETSKHVRKRIPRCTNESGTRALSLQTVRLENSPLQ